MAGSVIKTGTGNAPLLSSRYDDMSNAPSVGSLKRSSHPAWLGTAISSGGTTSSRARRTEPIVISALPDSDPAHNGAREVPSSFRDRSPAPADPLPRREGAPEACHRAQ